jgi:hypothetical protein
VKLSTYSGILDDQWNICLFRKSEGGTDIIGVPGINLKASTQMVGVQVVEWNED